MVLEDVSRIVGAGEWLDEFWIVDEERKLALLLGKGDEGICDRVMESVYCIGWVGGGREGSNCCIGRLLLDIGPPPSCYLPPSLNSWTQCIAFDYCITVYLVCHFKLGGKLLLYVYCVCGGLGRHSYFKIQSYYNNYPWENIFCFCMTEVLQVSLIANILVF